MDNTEDSISTLHYEKNKPSKSINEVHPEFNQDPPDKNELNLKNQLQSGIYIKFR